MALENPESRGLFPPGACPMGTMQGRGQVLTSALPLMSQRPVLTVAAVVYVV